MIRIKDMQMPDGCSSCPFMSYGGSIMYCLAQKPNKSRVANHVIEPYAGHFPAKHWKESTCPLLPGDGQWEEDNPQNSEESRLIRCSECGYTYIVGFNVSYIDFCEEKNYCMRCGAHMKGGETE